jgi:hypothetical protein
VCGVLIKDNKRRKKTPNVYMEIIFPILILMVVLKLGFGVGFCVMFNQDIYSKFSK